MKLKALLLAIVLILPFMTRSQGYDYRVVQSGDDKIMTGSMQFFIDDEQLMARTMMWVLNQADQLMDNITDHDYKRGRILLSCVLEGKDYNYVTELLLQVSNHRLVYHFGNIEAKKRSGIKKLLGGSTQFNRLEPEKNVKHRKIISEFELKARALIEDIMVFIDHREVNITNWENVITGKLQNGMSEDDVWLIYGKPINRQEIDNQAQLLYNNFMHIFLENGVVVSIVK